jgi:hypothetical protein
MDDRQEHQSDMREGSQDARKDRMDDRQEFADDHYDDYHHHGYYDNDGAVLAGVIVGAAIVGAATASTGYVTVLPCSAPAIIVDGVSYYNCSSTWYQRGYAGGQVSYVVGGPPPGY